MTGYARDDVAALLKAVLAFGRRLRSERTSTRVTSSAASMLNTLSVRGPMPTRQLAIEERLQPQSLTRIVKRLEEDGLIRRDRGKEDQRELIIALTKAGTRELDADLLERQRWLEQVVADTLSEGDRALLGDVARLLLKLAFHDTEAKAQETDMPSWVQHAIFWHIYPLGFVGAPKGIDMINDIDHHLDHIIDWLDYAVELGVSALLLGPIFASSTHGYDTIDHYRIDPRLGDEADLDRLVAAANQRGLKIVLDGVFNHVGRGFPKFIEAEDKGPESEAARWFLPIDGDGPNGTAAWKTFEGHEGLIALNHENADVADYVLDVMTHWLDRGVSGWRLDAAYATPTSFWQKILPAVRQSHPEAYVFGEVIHGDYVEFVQETGVDAVTQYELWKAIWSALNENNFFELAWALDRNNRFLEHFAPFTFVGNHDVTRIASQLEDARHLPHALALLLLTGGTPCIYSGDEQGFKGIKEEREGGDDAVRPAFPDNPDGLLDDGLPLYRLHQDLIGLRRRNPWLVRARSEALHLENQQMVLKISAKGNRLILAFNLGDDDADLPAGDASSLLLGDGTLNKDSKQSTVHLKAHGWCVLSS
ncbi:alpha-amylase family glycosyl hydrolase [Cohaesibacter sp. ES.047]|uniref:alpha-amylase family glycosyl hydrolase n=1 Tax=Cohaesibacter sp. ES.047 TaxID=1798205 RepID=UPI0015604E95|nr:alpha-amylase family glycosyl hydrolase [Cohaesibacter sp. ES.047]